LLGQDLQLFELPRQSANTDEKRERKKTQGQDEPSRGKTMQTMTSKFVKWGKRTTAKVGKTSEEVSTRWCQGKSWVSADRPYASGKRRPTCLSAKKGQRPPPVEVNKDKKGVGSLVWGARQTEGGRKTVFGVKRQLKCFGGGGPLKKKGADMEKGKKNPAKIKSGRLHRRWGWGVVGCGRKPNKEHRPYAFNYSIGEKQDGWGLKG